MPIEGAASASTEFLGVEFADVSADALLAALAGAPTQERFSYLVTPNVDHLVQLAAENPDRQRFLATYQDADLIVCDSRVLALLARLRGVRLTVVTGSDLTRRLLDEVIDAGDLITIVGGTAETADLLRRRYPGVRFRQHVPPMGLRRNPAAMDEAASLVAAEPARFVFLAVGSPQQELLAKAIKDKGGASGVGLCVGASIDFIVGNQKRAPVVMQKLALEWAWRLLQNPGRMWRRYLWEGPRIVLAVARWKRGRA
jgi:exopolysaccharide biosynthesis WecB/TagA/CpsF family protein